MPPFLRQTVVAGANGFGHAAFLRRYASARKSRHFDIYVRVKGRSPAYLRFQKRASKATAARLRASKNGKENFSKTGERLLGGKTHAFQFVSRDGAQDESVNFR